MLVKLNVMPMLAILVCLFSLSAVGSNAFESDIHRVLKSDVKTDTETNSESDFEDDRDKSLMKCRNAVQTSILSNDLTKFIANQHFTLLGKAKFSVLFWDIYESSLLTTDGQRPFSNACQHSLFEIHYLRDISKKELLDNTVSQWRHLSLNKQEYLAFLPLLENIWLDISAGDRLSMLNQKGTTIFYLNRQNIGEIESLTFAKTFLRIWLDENTSEPVLRQQLLGATI